MKPTIHTYVRAGANPQSPDPNVSGDTVVATPPDPEGRIVGVIDGAWVAGFEGTGIDPAHWAARTAAELFTDAGPSAPDLARTVSDTIPRYAAACKALKRRIGAGTQPPRAYANIDLRKVNPQAAFALARLCPDGGVEIAQVRDCMVALEDNQGRVCCLTPDQSASVAGATHGTTVAHESPAAYLHAMRAAHAPDFFALARETLDWLCLHHNASHFLNRTDGAPAWAMLTGEPAMLNLMTHRRLDADTLTGARRLWLVTDGAFRHGAATTDLTTMARLGPKHHDTDVIQQRLAGRFHTPDAPPTDIAVVQVHLAPSINPSVAHHHVTHEKR